MIQELSLDKQLVIVIREVFEKRRFCAVSFAFISMIVVSVGLVWPKTYQSSTSILWDRAQVVKPLLEGTVVSTSGKGHTEMAREVIFSNRNLDTLIREAELNISDSGERLSDKEIELLKSELKRKIVIERTSDEILRISYKSDDPEEAYLVVSIVSRLFIEETTLNKKDDSVNAYNFIQNQVDKYQKKLNAINQSIIDFKSNNMEIQVDTTAAVNSRINALKDGIKATSLQLKEAIIQRDSLQEQLIKESQKSTAEEEVIVRNDRLVALENKLNTLRLSYTETYPDIVLIKEQIKILKERISNETDGVPKSDDTPSTSSGTGFRSPLYDRLKQQIATQETLIKTLKARKLDQEKRFEHEISRSAQVNRVVAKLEELARDRDVTKQLYDQLLARLENARVSLNLELESASSLFKVQEPPLIPLLPEGLRFLHFAIGSVFLGTAVPLGLVIGILLIDPRVRHEDVIDIGDDIPIIGVVPSLKTEADLRKQRMVTAQSISIVSISLLVIAMLSISRYYEVI